MRWISSQIDPATGWLSRLVATKAQVAHFSARVRADRRQRLLRSLTFQHLEDRQLLTGSATPTELTPAQISHAYGFDQTTFDNGTVVGNGAGTTIAIIDAYDDPNIAGDLQAFDQYFGLPAPPSFTKMGQDGSDNLPITNPGSVNETSMDVEWAHALVPDANILLVEDDATSAGADEAIAYAASVPGVDVISMSFGSAEYAGETANDSLFTTPAGHNGVTFIGSSGDHGTIGPEAVSPNVLAVGGTTLTVDASGDYLGEIGWVGSGGGVSLYESQPSYQNGVVSAYSTTQRVVPDVSFDADEYSPVAVYNSFNNGVSTPWGGGAGTSFATPAWAAVIAIADQGRALNGLGSLYGTSTTAPTSDQTMPLLYSAPSADFHDITTGTNGYYSAGPGYDPVTGLGSPVVNKLTQWLSGSGPDVNVTEGGQTIADGETMPSLASGTDFGSTPVAGATETFTITNNGTSTLNLTGAPLVQISGADASDFTVLTQPASSLAVDASTTFQVRFVPGGSGERTATVSISSNASGQPAPFTFNLQGTESAGSPVLAVSENSVSIADREANPSTLNGTDFGTSVVGSAGVSETFTLTNTGTSTLHLTGTSIVQVGGTAAGDFSITQPAATNLAPGGSTTFQITFLPTAGGARTATITIDDDDSSQPNPFTFAIAGTGADLGSWQELVQALPSGGNIGSMILLSNGNVMVQEMSTTNWYLLTPSASGSYVDGTYTQVASMSTVRNYFTSAVLPSGEVLVLGGQQSNGQGGTNFLSTGEIYNPTANTWTLIASFPLANYSTGPAEVLSPTAQSPDGLVMVGSPGTGTVYFYDPNANTWSLAENELYNDPNTGADWVKLPDGSILSYSYNSNNAMPQEAQRYVPSLNEWFDAGAVPVSLQGSGSTLLGPAMLLPDGQVFFAGASGATALYTPPSTLTGTGTWTIGPTMPAGIGAYGGSAAVLPNGDMLFDGNATPGFNDPTSLYEYVPTTNTILQVPTYLQAALTEFAADNSSYASRMLMLPSGQLLFSAGPSQTYAYTPFGSASSAWQPAITNIAVAGADEYTLSGTQLNGLDEGAVRGGDGAGMASNYPIVELTSLTGQVTFAQTSNWSSTAVATGSAAETVEFTVPASLPTGQYSVKVVANGIASAPMNLDLTENQAPTLQVPSAVQSVPMNGSLTFSSGTSNAISMADADSEGNVEQLTISATAGTLSISNSSGLSSIAGNNSSSVTLQGTVASINSAINGLVYNAPSSTALVTLTVTANDLGNTGLGGALTATNTIVVNVNSGSSTQLVLTTQPPSTVVAGGPFSMTVAVEDSLGDLITSFNGSVSVVLATNPGSSTLGGTTTVTAVGGVAVFPGLTLNQAGTGYSLLVTSGSFSSALTSSITVTGNVRSLPAPTSGTEFQVNTYTTNSQALPKVAADAAGDYVIVWQSKYEDGSLYGVYAQRYNAAGVAQGSEFQVNSYTTGNQAFPAVAMDAAGDFVVVWGGYGQNGDSSAQQNIYAQRYNAAGVAQGSNFLVNSYTTGSQARPSVGMDAEGDFVVAWQSFPEQGTTYGIFAQRYSAAGVAEGNEFHVDTYSSGASRQAAVAMDAAGDFVISWNTNLEDGANYGIYAQRYNAAGTAQGGNFQVNTYTTSFQRFSATAMDEAGDFVIVWSSYTEDGSSYGIYGQRYNATGTAQGTEFQVNTYTTNSQAFPGVAMDSAGDFVVSWMSNTEDGSAGGVYARRYNSAGVAQGNEFRVNSYTAGTQGTIAGGTDVGPAVAMDAEGDFIVAWSSAAEDGSSYGIYAQRYVVPSVSASPAAVGSEFHVNTYTTGAQKNPRIASDAAGDYVIVWQSYEDGGSAGVYGQRYNAGGVAQGSEFRINTYTTGNQYAPVVAMDSAGDFVVAWNSIGEDGSMYGVYAQRYNAEGVKQGSEFQVNTYTTGNQYFPSVAMDSTGDFVISWESYGQDGSQSGVYAQRYASTGSALGSEFQVNTYTTGNQIAPAVAMDAAGDFVITFYSGPNQDGSGTGVYAQLYRSSGATVGSVFLVNTYTTSNQAQPAIAMDSAGDFVVSWVSTNQDGSGYGIYAQRYNSSGAAQGSEFRVNSYTTGNQGYNSIDGTAVALDSAGDFVVTWMSYGQDGSGYGVYGQRYNASGVVQGSEFRVNTYTTGAQAHTAVAMDSLGDFIVTWQSYSQDGSSYGIYAQRYGFNTAPTITTASSPLLYAANSGAEAFGSGLSLTDGENTFINSVTVSISSGYISGEDVLGFANQNGISGIFNTGSGSLTLTGSASVASYLAALQSITYTDTAHDASTANRTMTFTVNDGITSAAAGTLVISPQADVVTQLVITGQPPATVTAGATFSLTVTAEDVDGAVVPGYGGSVSVALASNPTGDTLGGTTSVGFTSGVAVFSGVTLNLAGSSYTLQASNGTFVSAPSNAISVTPGTATQLLITTGPPATVTAGSPFSFTVTAEDAEGNVATGFSGSETVSLASNPGGSTLGGTLVVSANSGVATFSGLTLNKVGSGYTLAVTSGTLASATTSAISVTPGTATQLLISTQPPSTVTAGSPFGFTVTAEDAEGNLASEFTGSETVAIANNPGGSTLGGTLIVGASGGIAIFSGLMLNQAGSGYTLQVNSGMLTSAPSNPITVTSNYTGPLTLALDAGVTNYSTTFQPGGVAIENTSGVTIDDNSNISGATIQIVSLRDGVNESLSVDTGVTGIMKSYNAATGMLTLMGSASIAAYESVLETITYNDSASVPNTATRNIQFTVTDGNNQKSNVALATVSFIGNYVEAAGPASVANPTVVIDPNVNVNATSITSATVAISSGFVSSTEDVLGLSSQFQQNYHITLSYPAPGEIVLTGTSQTTPVEYQLELDAVTYTNTNHYFSPSDLQKTFTFTIQGSSGSSAADVKTFDIVPVNTNPTVTTTTGPLNYTALSGAQLVDPGVTVTDPDPLNITGATISISSGFTTGQDTLAETASLPANVSASYSSSTGVLTLSGTASQSQYQALLAGVAYTNNGLGLNSRTISFAVNSNSLSSNVAGNTQYTKVISFTSPTVARFDFNSGAASAAPGFVGVGPSRSWSLSNGYGFSDAVTNFAPFTASAVESLAGVSSTYAPMYEDGIVSPTNSPQDFTLSTTVGTTYDLRVYVGNPNLSLHGIQVTVYTGSLTNLQQTQIGQSTVISTAAGGSNAFAAVEIDNLTAGGVTTAAGSEITVVIRSTTGSVYTEGLDVALHGDLPAIAHQDPAGGIAPAGNPPVAALNSSQLQPIVAQAITDWASAGITPAQISLLRSTQFVISDLKGQGALALTGSTGDTNTVQIDSTADGYGWFVDPTVADQPAASQMDLLTVVTHELGHVLGLPDVSAALLPNDLMDTELPTGVRRLPSPADLDALASGSFAVSANAAPIPSGTPVAMVAEMADAQPNAGGVTQPLAPITALAINAATDNADLDDDGFSVSMSELDAYFSQLG